MPSGPSWRIAAGRTMLFVFDLWRHPCLWLSPADGMLPLAGPLWVDAVEKGLVIIGEQ